MKGNTKSDKSKFYQKRDPITRQNYRDANRQTPRGDLKLTAPLKLATIPYPKTHKTSFTTV